MINIDRLNLITAYQLGLITLDELIELLEAPLRQMLLEMSLEGIEAVIDVIRSRKDIVSVELLTGIDLLEMKAEDEAHFRGLVTQIRKDIENEPA